MSLDKQKGDRIGESGRVLSGVKVFVLRVALQNNLLSRLKGRRNLKQSYTFTNVDQGYKFQSLYKRVYRVSRDERVYKWEPKYKVYKRDNQEIFSVNFG